MNKKRADMLSQQNNSEDDVDNMIENELNDNDFQREWTKALESGNPEELEAFEKKWGLNQYGIDAMLEELKEGINVDSSVVVDDGIQHITEKNLEENSKFIINALSEHKER